MNFSSLLLSAFPGYYDEVSRNMSKSVPHDDEKVIGANVKIQNVFANMSLYNGNVVRA